MLPSARRRTAALFPIRWLALASTALALAGPVFAAKEAPPVADLTQSGKLEEKFSHDPKYGDGMENAETQRRRERRGMGKSPRLQRLTQRVNIFGAAMAP